MPRSSTRRSVPPPSVALFVDEPDWHTRRLKKALASQGAAVNVLSLRMCGLDTACAHGLALPGFGDALPDGAFVRTIAAGSFEQVTIRLGVLHALRELGVCVYNDARAIERCVDKSMTSFCLQRAGIPTPPTWTVESPERALEIVRAEALPDRPLVMKPLFGSQGRGLRLVHDIAGLPAPEETAGVYYLQHYVGSETARWHDWRIFVVGKRAIAAMVRHGVEWRTNAARGARCEAAEPTGEIARLAVAAAQSVGVDYAGVDIIADRGGRLLVLEVNSMPAWKSLQNVSATDVADALAADFLSRLRAAPGRRPPVHAVASR
jgi:tetrahydromethanopterin:alpha-L-glutamate ligase